MSECNYFKAATSVCLRTVQAVIHFIQEGERRFEHACEQHYAEIMERIGRAGHEIVEVSSACCHTEPGANEGCCADSLR